jgi:hypothetical protein
MSGDDRFRRMQVPARVVSRCEPVAREVRVPEYAGGSTRSGLAATELGGGPRHMRLGYSSRCVDAFLDGRGSELKVSGSDGVCRLTGQNVRCRLHRRPGSGPPHS